MPPQIFAGRDQGNPVGLVVTKLTHEEVEELRAFIPPMPEQLGVIRRDDDWRSVQNGFQLLNLRDALTQKMPCVSAGGRQRMVALVNLLLPGAGDAEVFQAGEAAI